jgi:hypothetical protein
MKEMLKGVVSLLGADASITTALGSSKIYSIQAPESAARPYIVITEASGISVNRTPRDETDVVLIVKCVADTALKAADVRDLIRARLHRNSDNLSLDNSWSAYWMTEEGRFLYAENVDRKQVYHGGANYRIRASKQS